MKKARQLTLLLIALALAFALLACAPTAEAEPEVKEEVVLYIVQNPVENLLPYVLVYPIQVDNSQDQAGEGGAAGAEAGAAGAAAGTEAEQAEEPSPVVPTLEWASFRLVLGETLEVLEEGISAKNSSGETIALTLVRTMNGSKVAIEQENLNSSLYLGTTSSEQALFTRPSITAISNIKLAAGTVFGVLESSEGFSRIIYRDPTGTAIRTNLWIGGGAVETGEISVLENIFRTLYRRQAVAGSAVGKKVLAIAANGQGANPSLSVRLKDIIDAELAGQNSAGAAAAQGAARGAASGISEELLPHIGLSQAVNLSGKTLGLTFSFVSLDDISSNSPVFSEIAQGTDLAIVHLVELGGNVYLRLSDNTWVHGRNIYITN